MPWYVLYTKPRNEKKLAMLLEQKGNQVYCPLHETIRQWSDRKKKVQEPVFKSYVFVWLGDYERECAEVLMTAGAVRFVRWLGKPGVVRDEEIEQIRAFLNNYKNSDISITVTQGQEVQVQEGFLKDATGTVLKVTGNTALLHLKSLGMNLVARLPIQSLSVTDSNT